MPSDVVKSFADKTGKSVETVEKMWQEAVKSVKDAHPKMGEDNPRFYAMVTAALKKMLNLDEQAGAGAPAGGVGGGAGGVGAGGIPAGQPIAVTSTTTKDIAQFANKMVVGPKEKKRKRKWQDQIDKFL